MRNPFSRANDQTPRQEGWRTPLRGTWLKRAAPRERYRFHCDWMDVDDRAATILDYHHTAGANDQLPAFWGLNLIPTGLGDQIDTVNITGIRRMSDAWISDHQARAETVAGQNMESQNQTGTATSRHQAAASAADLDQVARELTDGASYLHVHHRLLVAAPDTDTLDDATGRVDRMMTERFSTMSAAPHPGDQARELATLLAPQHTKRGQGLYFTSSEFAGSWNLVTHGLEDPHGARVGVMAGDVNSSAILFDTDRFAREAVVATGARDTFLDEPMATRFARLATHQSLFNGRRVVHLVLDGARTVMQGLERMSTLVAMDQGALNMFEVFGSKRDELALFSGQLDKLVLMSQQAYQPNDTERAIMRSSLEQALTDFYTDRHMWIHNAKAHPERVRLTGIPHAQVPLLQDFIQYLAREYEKERRDPNPDAERVHAYGVLHGLYQGLLTANGDLFNSATADSFDHVDTGRHIVYDFAGLAARGSHIAMAQLVNVLGYATGGLARGDLLVVHGAEHVAPGVRDWMRAQLDRMHERGARTLWVYHSVARMLEAAAFNRFDTADYTILGTMSNRDAARYQELVGCALPAQLRAIITSPGASHYIRRGIDNVTFTPDFLLDPTEAHHDQA